MSSTSRITASRRNGAQSLGPKTDEGKQRSSQNSMRHGLLSATTVLRDESPEQFQLLLDEYVARLQPEGELEHAAVEEMVSAQWRLRRLRLIEKTMLDKRAARSDQSQAAYRITEAFACLSTGSALPLLDRYESRLTRIYQRAFKHLLLLREMRPVEEPAQPTETAEAAETAETSRPASPVSPPLPAETPQKAPDHTRSPGPKPFDLRDLYPI